MQSMIKLLLHKERFAKKVNSYHITQHHRCPKYLFDIIPQLNCLYKTRNAHNIPQINIKHQLFKKIYFFIINN